MRDEKLHAIVARSTFASENAKNTSRASEKEHLTFGTLLEVEMSKKCTPLWREAHLQVKKLKTPHVRNTFGSWDVEKVHAVLARSTFASEKTPHVWTTFGSWDVEKVHAVVARSTFATEKAKSISRSEHFWKLRCRKSARRCGAKHISKPKCWRHQGFGPLLEVQMSFCVAGARDCGTLSKSEKKREGFVEFFNYNHHYTTLHPNTLHYKLQTTPSLHATTLHYIQLHSTTLHSTTLHYATLHSITFNYTTLHYTTLLFTTLHYTTLHFTTLHYTTLHYTTLHYTTLHYTPLRLHDHSTTTKLHIPLHYTTLHSIPFHYATICLLHNSTLHYTHTTQHTTHYTTLCYTTLHYTSLHYTTLHYTTPHHTTLNYTTLHYPTAHCTTLQYFYWHIIDIILHSLHHHKCNCNYTTLITLRHKYNSTPLQLQLQLHYTTLHPAVVGEVTDQVTTATIASTPKNTAPTTFSVHQWIGSAIRDSQQPISPIGFPIFWNFRHCLVRYYWYIYIYHMLNLFVLVQSRVLLLWIPRLSFGCQITTSWLYDPACSSLNHRVGWVDSSCSSLGPTGFYLNHMLCCQIILSPCYSG